MPTIKGVPLLGRTSPIMYAIERRIADPVLSAEMRAEVMEVEVAITGMQDTIHRQREEIKSLELRLDNESTANARGIHFNGMRVNAQGGKGE